MIPVSFLAGNVSKELATDTTTLANVSAPKVALIIAPFVPGTDLDAASLTFGSVFGLAPLACVAGSQNEGVDPINGDLLIDMKPPAGGWRWETGIGFVGPVTVYGFALVDNTLANLYGTQLFANPIVLTVVNQVIELERVRFRIDPAKIT